MIALPGVTIEGDPGAVVVGSGTADAIRVTAPDATIRGLTIRGSGLSLIDKNSGILLDRMADRALVADNRLEDKLISVYLDGSHDAVVRNNYIQGLRTHRRTERGPAISLWNTPGSQIIGNDVRSGRDGVFSVSSSRNVVRGNSFHDLRFAVHFMYTNDTEVTGNLSEGNEVGYVMMYSDLLRVHDNIYDHDRDHGVLFNYANASWIEGNVVRDSEKCVFFYNASKNRFAENWFEACQIGIHFTAGSERNEITGNAFVGYRTQVMYVGTRLLDWSVNGRGNYYSDNPAFDVNGDGIANSAYRPNNLTEQVIWRAPAAKLLLNSPATQVVRWAQAQFPAIHPGGVVDTAPRWPGWRHDRGYCRHAWRHAPLRPLAVNGWDLTLRAGACVGLVGHNCAGKRTLVKMMLGLVRPSVGSVQVLEEDPSAGAAALARRELGYLPENVALYPSMTGAETLAFYARLKRQPVGANVGLLERVGIAGAARRRVGTYSKGMRQRLGLAQALLGNPRALLLDEPTSGLDATLRHDFYGTIRELCRNGTMVLLSSHPLAELEGQVDRVVVMNQGRKVADGSIPDLRGLAAVQPRIRLRLPRALRAVANGPDPWAG